MLEVFTNPGYLAAAAALVSAPIIIHLINRMRYKRIRWAAMEFLLKAQKRMRKRLIIEQLILLALRCLLVALVGLLVMRFVGFSFADIGAKPGLHIVLLDDTLSTSDEWKEGESARDAFTIAKNDVLVDKIVKGISQSSASDRLMLIPLSKIGYERDFQPKVYEKLNDGGKLEDLKKDVAQLEASKLHVPVLAGVRKVQELVTAYPESRITFHILSDFRQREWALPDAEALHKLLVEMAKDRPDLKIRLIDSVHPYRTGGQGGMPLAHDNVGIVDLVAGTRVAGKDMPVAFTLSLANYSAREAEVNVVIYDDTTGAERLDVDFNPPMPIKIPAGSTDVKANFDLRFNPNIRAGETYFAQISARLESAHRGKLENDGLAHDNVRHAAVEIRDKVPVLLVDWAGARGRFENKDSFFIRTAIISVPGSSYDVEYGDELGASIPTKVLERSDLRKFPTIFMLNVREFTPKQLAGLENYVKEGGGVAFFMGPQVNPNYYNKNLYKDGKGLFPVPLKETYFPSASEEPLKPEYTGHPQVLLRDKLFPTLDAFPIFGAVFKEEKQRGRLKDLPIKRYYQVPRSEWLSEPGRVFELATLPNDVLAATFQRPALDIVKGQALEKILENDELKKYRRGLERHRRNVESIISPTSEKKAYILAEALEKMLQDTGKEKERDEYPNLTEFWTYPDPKISTLREAAQRVIDQARFGDPFIIAAQYGKGKVVAIMTTAGKEWNDWGGGSDATLIYQPFIWEMQNYLSSQGSESNLMVGSPVQVRVETEAFKQKGSSGGLKMTRVFNKAEQGKPVKVTRDLEQFAQEDKGVATFSFEKNLEPGLYVASLNWGDAGDKQIPLAVFGHVFNVDTTKEGTLARVASDEIDRNVVRQAPQGSIRFEGPGVQGDDLVSRRTDLSESPWLFLVFILVLVAEQALAVHLSFHLRGSETEALSKLTQATPKQAA
ncbi:MAG: BatA domain-containing protein [Gemmataceae bacterium]|nr:BatA domain-containing protein [Gemmataceae bacterium]MCI0740965.1 BatA domain-containing protein [Gemmataceae bacterium]